MRWITAGAGEASDTYPLDDLVDCKADKTAFQDANDGHLDDIPGNHL